MFSWFPYTLGFQEPLWLLLLLFIPVLWGMSRRSLAGLGGTRALIARILRTVVFAGIVFALAGAEWNERSSHLAVAYLLDQSESIPPEHREAMLEFVQQSVERHRRSGENDRAAVIVFGRQAVVEYPPVEFTPTGRNVQAMVDQTATNLQDALAKAAAILPADSARRVVVVSDGNENLGVAAREARRLVESGFSIDVVPVPPGGQQDLVVEHVAAPPSALKDQPLEVRVVLANRGENATPASGTLRVVRKAGGVEELVVEEEVQLPPGKSVFSFREEPKESDFYTYEARLIPSDRSQDRFVANNTASGFVDVRGAGRVLLVEDSEHPGEFDGLVESLRQEGIEIDLRPSDRAFSSLAELQRYDSVLLANVARTSGSSTGAYASLSDDQISMLVRNTREMGCGLVMLGGSRSFGAGGWTDTELEKAMPVDFRIKNAKAIPVGALSLVIDRSGSMTGDNMRLSVAAAKAAVRMLGPRDYISVTSFDTEPYRVVPLERVGDGRRAQARISRITAGGGTDLYPAMRQAYQELLRAEASVKHMIVLTDGHTPDAAFTQLCDEMLARGITVSGVAVGQGADRRLVAQIAARGGGKFYAVPNPAAVPQIFMHEARRVATPLIRLLNPPQAPVLTSSHELLRGIGTSLPPIEGFVQTTVKESPLVEVLFRSPVPEDERNATLLATWNYGLGKAVALTTDAGHQWANRWTGWENYDKLFSQLVRWSMRPVGGSSKYQLATQSDGERTQVIVNALDDDDELASQIGMLGRAVGPSLESTSLTFEQVGPGRYSAEFPTPVFGSYFVTVAVPEGPPLRAGVNVGYSREYEVLGLNLPLLENLASGIPRGGAPGSLISAPGPLPFTSAAGTERALEIDHYRRDLPFPVSRQDVWPLVLLVASVIFLADVFVRRVQVDFAAQLRKLGSLIARQKSVVTTPTLARLSSRKAEVRKQYQARTLQTPVAELTEQLQKSAAAPNGSQEKPKDPPPVVTSPVAEESYTSRLLAAKRAAAKEHGMKGESGRRKAED